MKSKRYSLFEITYNDKGKKVYTRISMLSFVKPTALRVFQDALLESHFNPTLAPRELRPVKDLLS